MMVSKERFQGHFCKDGLKRGVPMPLLLWWSEKRGSKATFAKMVWKERFPGHFFLRWSEKRGSKTTFAKMIRKRGVPRPLLLRWSEKRSSQTICAKMVWKEGSPDHFCSVGLKRGVPVSSLALQYEGKTSHSITLWGHVAVNILSPLFLHLLFLSAAFSQRKSVCTKRYKV